MYINVVYTIGSWISQSLYNIPFWEMSVELRSPFSDLSSFLNSLDSSIREFSFSMKPPSTSSSCTVNMTAALYWPYNYYHLTANLFLANQHVQLQKCCTDFSLITHYSLKKFVVKQFESRKFLQSLNNDYIKNKIQKNSANESPLLWTLLKKQQTVKKITIN